MEELTPEIITSIKRIKYILQINGLLKKLPTDNNNNNNHTCYKDMCHPVNEPFLVQHRMLQGPPQTHHVYVCCYEYVHICDKQHCVGQQRQGSCAITGKSFGHHQLTSSYDSNDYRTFGNYQSPGGLNTFCFNGDGNGSGDGRSPRISLTNSSQNVFATLKKEKEKDEKEKKEEEEEEDEKEKQPSYSRKHRRQYGNYIREHIQSIVYNLLYGRVRKRMNANHEKIQSENKKLYWKRYKQHCRKKKLIDIVHGMVVNSNCIEPPPFKIAEHDPDREAYYVKIIHQIYTKIAENIDLNHAFTRIDIQAVTLYVLYAMRTGLIIEGVPVLSIDSFLQTYLPDVNQLIYFNFNRKKIKLGAKLMRDAYSNVMQDHEELHIKGYNPEQHSVKRYKSTVRAWKQQQKK